MIFGRGPTVPEIFLPPSPCSLFYSKFSYSAYKLSPVDLPSVVKLEWWINWITNELILNFCVAPPRVNASQISLRKRKCLTQTSPQCQQERELGISKAGDCWKFNVNLQFQFFNCLRRCQTRWNPFWLRHSFLLQNTVHPVKFRSVVLRWFQ